MPLVQELCESHIVTVLIYHGPPQLTFNKCLLNISEVNVAQKQYMFYTFCRAPLLDLDMLIVCKKGSTLTKLDPNS